MKHHPARMVPFLAAILGLGAAENVDAAAIVIDAKADTLFSDGLATGIALSSGEPLKVQVAANDIWSAGSLPRWADADGLTKNLYATGFDESGQPAGTLIGRPFGPLTVDGFTAPFASLVGKIGSTYHLLGRDFAGTAWASGELRLYFWDQTSYDNIDHITAQVTHGFPVKVGDPGIGAVPEPASWALMIVGVGMTGAALRRRTAGPGAPKPAACVTSG